MKFFDNIGSIGRLGTSIHITVIRNSTTGITLKKKKKMSSFTEVLKKSQNVV